MFGFQLDLAQKTSSAIFAHHGSNYTIGTASEIYCKSKKKYPLKI